jgi:cellulose synthase/poly-beta-1,6-N-acetylglucosamine synthase-like glycosyltransferase
MADTDRYLDELSDRVRFHEGRISLELERERGKLAELLEREDQLWKELRQVTDRLGHKGGNDPQPSAQMAPPLGQLLLERKAVTEEQLAEALAYQERYGGRLGEILIEQFGVDPMEVLQAVEQRNRTPRLGEMLVHHGLITPEQLQAALDYQKVSGGKLGEIIASLHLVEPDVLYRFIATQYKIGRIGKTRIQEGVPKLPERMSRELKAVVIGERETRFLVAVSELLEDHEVEQLEAWLQKPIEQVYASPEEMEDYWEALYPEELTHISTQTLKEEQPYNSAHVTFTNPQLVWIFALLIAFAAAMVHNWKLALIAANCVVQSLYFLMTCFKCYILFKGANPDNQIRFTDEEIDAMDEATLPVYTILVPMYREANIIPKLIANLEKLDYPKFKLDIRLLLEEDDTEAIELVKRLNLPPYYSLVVVPHSLPKTKPKACNYGLIHARGEYVVIYDAEDRPDRRQLKKAVAAFRSLPDDYVCIQAKLNYFNSTQNLLTRWFTQEYSMWFELLLPGVMKLDVPIPLGGTSNHFKMQVLKDMRAWDPYNVTEDADLGVRLYKHGCKTAIMDSVTWEEANSRVGNWIRQRSRWIKGYMQTWLVNMRHPVRLWKELGTKGFWGFQVMVLSSPALPLINPIFWAMVILWFAWEAKFIPLLFPGPIYYMSAAMFLFGNFVFIYSHAVGMHWVIQDMNAKGDRRFSYGLVKYALLTPLYWVLMSLAAMKAFWQLITKPFYWEKTLHGLTEKENTQQAAAPFEQPLQKFGG